MGKTILMSIHDIDLALQIADNIWLLDHDGRLISGTPRQLSEAGEIDQHVVNENIEFDRSAMTFHVRLHQ